MSTNKYGYHCMPIWERFTPATRKKMIRAFKVKPKRTRGAFNFDYTSEAYKPSVTTIVKGKRRESVCPLAYALMHDGLIDDVTKLPERPGGDLVAKALMGIDRNGVVPHHRKAEFDELYQQARQFYVPWDARRIEDLADAACVKAETKETVST